MNNVRVQCDNPEEQTEQNQPDAKLSLVSQVAKAFFRSPEPGDSKEESDRGFEVASAEELQEIQDYIDSKRLCMKRRAKDEIFFEDKTNLKSEELQTLKDSHTEKKTKDLSSRKMEKLKVFSISSRLVNGMS